MPAEPAEPAAPDAGPPDAGPAETILLVPSHGLDDLPERLPGPHAAAALHAFALAWRPELLRAARALPRLVMVDQPPRPVGGRRFLIPGFLCDRLPDGWEAEAGDRLAVIGSDRDEAFAAAERLARGRDRQAAGPGAVADGGGRLPDGRVSNPPKFSPDDCAPFFALGLGHLWVERLTRRTHYYSTLDETRLRTEAIAAADALFAGDRDELKTRLTEAAEVLREARERFYPTGATLCDLCLVIPRLAGAALRRDVDAAAAGGPPLNLLATGADWNRIAAESPDLIAAIREAPERVEPVGGEEEEIPAALRDVTAALGDMGRGRESFGSLFGRQPGVWGRYRFGFTPLTPQLLESAGVNGALHLVFGDGDVPPDGAGRVRWAGAGGEVSAHARPPVPAGGAAAFWELPETLAEAFEAEQTVAVTFARWPGAPCEWLDRLKALTALSPVLGEFATYSTMFAEDDPFARLFAADPRKYRSRTLAAAIGSPDPIATHARAIRSDADDREDRLFAGLADLLASGGRQPPELGNAEPAERLAALIGRGGGDTPGTLWLNPLPIPRTAALDCGDQNTAPAPPADHPAVKVVGPRSFTCELPPGGFVWFPDRPAKGAKLSKAKARTADPGVVRNERFEVQFDPTSGGIAAVKNYGRSPVRLGMRPAVRFREPRVNKAGDREWYSRAARLEPDGWEVIDAGPSRGELLSRGDLLDPAGGVRLCGFTLRVSLDRGCRTAAVVVSFSDAATALEQGEVVLRWAWDDETAELARSIQGTRQAAPADGTFEAAHYFELTSLHGAEKLRTAVLTPDAPFQTRRGRRMLDTPLLVAGEQVPATADARLWRFGIAVDDPHPMRAADDWLHPPTPIPLPGPPASGPVGWLLACDSPGVRVLSLRTDGGETLLRMQETDGRTRTATVRFFKRPAGARKHALNGDPKGELICESDAVKVPLAGYELCDVAVRW